MSKSQEQNKERDAVLKHMLATPPQPKKPIQSRVTAKPKKTSGKKPTS